jgi:hypothetical protein
MAGGIVGVFGVTPVAAAPASLTLSYTCAIPLIGNYPGTVRVNADISTSAALGRPSPTFVVNAAALMTADTAWQLRLVGIRTVEGTANGKVVVTAPQGNIDLTVPFSVPRTTIPASGPFNVPVTGSAPSVTFTRPGRGKIVVGDIMLRLTPKGADGNVTFPGTFDAPCKLDPGQNTILASFNITGETRTADKVTPAPGPSPSTDHAGNGAKDAATTNNATRASDSTNMTGSQDTNDLILLVVGTLVVGALATGAIFHLRSRRRNPLTSRSAGRTKDGG